MRPPSRWLPVAASALLLSAACNDRMNAPSPIPGSLVLTSIDPSDGFVGQRVFIDGTGFAAGATITFGGVPASNLFVRSNAAIGTIPPHGDGPVDVVVTNPDGQSATAIGGFTYVTVSLTVSASVVRPGEPIPVSWAVPGRRQMSDWIGLFAASVPSDSEIDDGLWRYAGSESGSMTFTAPGPGDYEFRYFPGDGIGDVARVAVAVR